MNVQPTFIERQRAFLRRVRESDFNGRAVLVASANIRDTLVLLTDESAPTTRTLILVWDRLSAVSNLLTDVLNELALAAKEFWPAWYFPSDEYFTQVPILNFLRGRADDAGVVQQVSIPWLTVAHAACGSGNSPRSTAFTPQVEIRQLALALGDRACRLILATTAVQASTSELRGFARLVELLVHETGLPVTVVVAPLLAEAPEFDSIGFTLIEATEQLLRDQNDGAALLRDASALHPSSHWPVGINQALESRPHSLLLPLVGKPHPNSQGEQQLWDRLQKEPEFIGLFEVNKWVQCLPSSLYLVDFLCRSVKFIIEIDGYYWHCSPTAFARDRHRDYELLLSGYRVLRLPHDEVLADLDATVEKIRNVLCVLRKADERIPS